MTLTEGRINLEPQEALPVHVAGCGFGAIAAGSRWSKSIALRGAFGLIILLSPRSGESPPLPTRSSAVGAVAILVGARRSARGCTRLCPAWWSTRSWPRWSAF